MPVFPPILNTIYKDRLMTQKAFKAFAKKVAKDIKTESSLIDLRALKKL